MQPIDVVIIISYSAVIASVFAGAIYLLFKARGLSKNVRYYLLGISLFLIFYGIGRIIVFLFEFAIIAKRNEVFVLSFIPTSWSPVRIAPLTGLFTLLECPIRKHGEGVQNIVPLFHRRFNVPCEI